LKDAINQQGIPFSISLAAFLTLTRDINSIIVFFAEACHHKQKNNVSLTRDKTHLTENKFSEILTVSKLIK